MNTNEQVSIYRKRVAFLLQSLRNALFIESGRTSFPTDSSIACLLELSPTALSSISRSCASMTGPTLLKLLRELSTRCSAEEFNCLVSSFVIDDYHHV